MTFGNAVTLGLLVGSLMGAATMSWWGFVLFACAGGVAAGALWRARAAQPNATTAAQPPASDLAMLERRVARLEALVESALTGQARAATHEPVAPHVPPSIAAGAAPPPSDSGPRAATTGQPAPEPSASLVTKQEPPAPAYAPASNASPGGAAAAGSPGNGPLRKWLTEGNLPARVGVVVLFFGVAFLLRYFAQRFTIPVELRLAGVALVGAILVAVGARFVRTRPAFGLSVEAAGCGVLYLTTFAAFRLYGVLPSSVALVSLAAVAVLTVGLAMRHASQALAGLAIAGGFLAPMLVGGGGSPAALFAWFAGLNAAIFALAWRHSWRALNVQGFVFTFVLGLAWGYRFYRPGHFAVVEPFLALFFAFYVGIAVLYARRGPMSAKAPVDALLVFGVPLVGFALQFALVRDTRYGAAWSALALAVVYAGLFGLLRKRAEAGLALLARAFGLLAIVFVTVAIPNALDARWTSAWWAVEGACVYWIGCRQSQPAVRVIAVALELIAAGWFALAGSEAGDVRPFLNATFTGTVMISLSAWTTAWLAEHEGTLPPAERALSPWALGLGFVCWMLGAGHELARVYGPEELPSAALAWCAGTVIAVLLLHRWWRRLLWLGAPLLPALVIATIVALRREHTTLLHGGWIAWPLAFATQWWLMFAAERADRRRAGAADSLAVLHEDFLHAIGAIALVAWLAWEASEWVGRHTAPDAVWLACAAAAPAILALIAIHALARREAWPLATHAEAYQRQAGLLVAGGLVGWVVVTNVLSPGNPDPWPYAPLLNPLDVTSLAALWVLAAWSRDALALDARTRYTVLAGAGFVLLNGGVLRTAHHWADIAWNLRDLMASRPLQAALTLAWTVTALALMIGATRRGVRPWWIAGAVLLTAVVGKLFLVDLATLSGLPQVVAFLGVGALMLVIGFFAPLPPPAAQRAAGPPERPADSVSGNPP